MPVSVSLDPPPAALTLPVTLPMSSQLLLLKAATSLSLLFSSCGSAALFAC